MQQDGLEISFHLKNNTDSILERKKRSTIQDTTDTDRAIPQLKTEEYQKARDIIMNHNVLCNNENKNEICKDLVKKLKTITDGDHETNADGKKSKERSFVAATENSEPVNQHVRFSSVPMDMTKREVFPLPIPDELPGLANRDAFGYGAPAPSGYGSPYPQVSPYSLPYTHQPHVPDSCLLARLLKHGNPHHLGEIYCRT